MKHNERYVKTYRFVRVMKIPKLQPGNVQLARKQFRCEKSYFSKGTLTLR